MSCTEDAVFRGMSTDELSHTLGNIHIDLNFGLLPGIEQRIGYRAIAEAVTRLRRADEAMHRIGEVAGMLDVTGAVREDALVELARKCQGILSETAKSYWEGRDGDGRKRFEEFDELKKPAASKTPWSIEQDDVSGDFMIFDPDRRLVAGQISYEDDAKAIVNAINGGNGGDNADTEE